MVLVLSYGVLCYAVFLVTFLYAIGFVGDFGVPRSIDNGLTAPTGTAITIDVLLMSVFAIQHSVMARPGFKQWWTRLVPAPIERSTFVLASSLALILLFWQWRAVPAVVWSVSGVPGQLLFALSMLGWGLVLVATFLIDHFALFGVRQVVRHARGLPMPEPRFVVPAIYRFVRHPIMLGFLIAFWAAPVMTAGHLLFAIVTTAYVVVALHLEERDLVAAHGDEYRQYRREVSMLLPLPRRQR